MAGSSIETWVAITRFKKKGIVLNSIEREIGEKKN